MRIPLIVSTRANKDATYPTVMLRPGKWVVECDVEDFQFTLSCFPGTVMQHGSEVILENINETSLVCDIAEPSRPATVYLCLCR